MDLDTREEYGFALGGCEGAPPPLPTVDALSFVGDARFFAETGRETCFDLLKFCCCCICPSREGEGVGLCVGMLVVGAVIGVVGVEVVGARD